MTNSPALIVRHARFTPAVTMLLAVVLAVAAIGLSVELHKAGVGIALVLAPQVLVLLAAYLAKVAADRWRHTAVRLAVSAEGLTMPGITDRPIPWTAVTQLRVVCCSPVPEQGVAPRHYLFLAVEAPDSFGVRSRNILQRFSAPLPVDAPPITLDLTELDAGREAVLSAVHRFVPGAIGDAQPGAWANDASIPVPTVAELHLAARRTGAVISALAARRGEFQAAALNMGKSWALHAKIEGLALIAAAGTLQRRTAAEMRSRLSSWHDQVAAIAARTHTTVRNATFDLRHRLKRNCLM